MSYHPISTIITNHQKSSYERDMERCRRSIWRCGKRAYPRVMKGSIDSHGYVQVAISVDGKSKLMFVHRLVAKAFIPNPLNLEMVNHKDENPLNNSVHNLEWCTRSYNNSYGHATDSYRRAVCCIYGETAYIFNSIKEASVKMNIPSTSIFNALKRHSPITMLVKRNIPPLTKSSKRTKMCYND